MAENDKIRQAAIALISLGPETAGRVLQKLSPEEAEKLIKAVLSIKHISAQEKQAALAKLKDEMERRREELEGGKEKAEELLTKALGPQKAQEILERLSRREFTQKLRALQEYPVELVAKVLEKESDQIVAVTLAVLEPAYAAKILSFLDDSRKAAVARRIAKTQKISPEALERLAAKLVEELEKLSEENHLESKVDGEEILSQILRHMSPEKEVELLESLQREMPELGERLREKLFTFSDLLEVRREGIRLLHEMIPDPGVWARALKGAGRDLRQHIFNSVSINRAKDIADEMENLGPLPLREVEYHRRQIMQMAEKLREEGKLFFARDEDEYIY